MKVATDKTFKVEVKKGALPLTATAQGNTVKITEKLVEGDVLTITLKEEVEGKVTAQKSTEITVAAPADKTATKVSKVEPKDDAEKAKLADLKAGDKFTLTSEVLDQNNNVMPTEDVRWVSSDNDVVAVKDPAQGQTFKDAKDATFEAKKEGKATITAFTKDGKASKAFEVTVGKGQVAKIDATQAKISVVNKATADKANIVVNPAKDSKIKEAITVTNANNTAVPLKASEVDFEVVAPKDFAATDVKVEKVVDEQGYLTGLKVTSDRTTLTAAEKAGDYATGQEYTVKVKSTVKDVAETSFAVTSTIDAKVAKIETATTAEFRQGSSVEQPITFKNAKGETLNVKKEDLKITKDGLSVDALGTDKDGKFVPATDVVTGVKLAADKEGKASALLAVGAVSTTINATVDASATITTIELGKQIEVVAGGTDAVIQPITVKDQDGKAMEVATDKLKVDDLSEDDNKLVGTTIVKYGKDKDGKIVEATEENGVKTEGIALKVAPVAKVTLAKAKTIDVKVSEKAVAEGKEAVTSTVKVKINESAVLDKVTVEAKATTLTEGGTTTATVKPVDQYGNVVAGLEKAITVKENNVIEATTLATPIYHDEKGNVVKVAGKLVGYKVELEAKAAGTETVEFQVTTGDGKEAVTKTATQAFTVATLDEAVETVEIKDVEEVNNSKSKPVTLEAIGKDKDGKEVEIAKENLTWSIKSVKDANGNELKVGEQGQLTYEDETVKDKVDLTNATVTLKDGVLTASAGLTVEVEVEVKTDNLKKDTTVVKFNGEASKFVSGLTIATVADKAVEAGTLAVTIDDVEKQELALTFTGVDQYGKTFDVPEDKLTVTFGAQGVVEPTKANEVLTLKATGKADTVKMYVEYQGEALAIDVKVSKEVMDAIAAEKEAAEKELATAKEAFDKAKTDAQAAIKDVVSATTATDVEEGKKWTTAELLQAVTDANAVDVSKETDKAKVEAATKAINDAVKALNLQDGTKTP